MGHRHCQRVTVNHGGLTPPALGRARSPADGIATFAMHKRTRTRSGGCQPAVVLETYLHTRFRNRSADCRPARWRTPLQLRSWNHGGLTPPALGPARPVVVCERVRNLPRRRGSRTTGGLRPPLLVVAAFVHRKSRFFTVQGRTSAKSGTRQPAEVAATVIAMRFADARSTVSRVWGIVLASALP